MATLTTPAFIGRQAEIERLAAAARRAQDGEPSVVLVAGEAGIGKTRLVHEFASRLEADGWRTAVGHCLDLTTEQSPYLPLDEAFRDLEARFDPLDAVRGSIREVETHDGPADPDARTMVFAPLLETLGRASASTPVLLVLEDLHWADPSTRDALRFFARALRRERVLLVGTYRSDELHRTHPWLATLGELIRLPQVHRIVVDRFDRVEVAEQVESLVGHQVTGDVADRIHERSDGNAFYVEELVAVGAEADASRLPPSVRDIVFVRLGELSKPAREIAGLAAVAGRRVRHDMLADLSGLSEEDLTAALRELVETRILAPSMERGAPTYEFRHALTQEAVYGDLMPSERRARHGAIGAWLEAHDDHRRPPIAHLAELGHHAEGAGDRHAALHLWVEAGDEAVRILAFAEAHARYEAALAVWPDVPDAPAIAGMSELELTERAADAAGTAGAFPRAIALHRAALELLGPDGDVTRRARRYDRMAWCQWDLGDAAAAERTLEEAMASLPDRQPRWRARLNSALAQLHWSAGRHLAGVEAARHALVAAIEAADPVEEGWARMILGATLAGSGAAIDGIVELEAAAILLAGTREYDNVIAELCWALWLAGRFDEAHTLALREIDRALESGSRRYVPYFLSDVCDVLEQIGGWADVRRHLESVEWPRTDARAAAWLFQNMAMAALSEGNVNAARRAIDASGARIPVGAAHIDTFWHRVTETEVLLGELRFDDAHRVAAETIAASPDPHHDAVLWRFIPVAMRIEADIAERIRAQRGPAAEIDDHRGHAASLVRLITSVADDATAAGRMTPLIESYHGLVAAEMARVDGSSDPALWASTAASAASAGLRPVEAYALLREAEATLLGRGPAERATAALASARALATEMGDVPLLGAIDDLARRARLAEPVTPRAAASEPQHRSTDPWGLSNREREVLALLAGGRTNRQIGETLFISEKTASVHVTHILDKLGVSSRTEAALLAARAGVAPALTLEPDAP